MLWLWLWLWPAFQRSDSDILDIGPTMQKRQKKKAGEEEGRRRQEKMKAGEEGGATRSKAKESVLGK